MIPFNLVGMFAATSCPNYIAVVFRRRYFLPNNSSPFRRSIAKSESLYKTERDNSVNYSIAQPQGENV